MAIDTYQTSEAMALLDRIGWPSYTQGREQVSLRRDDWQGGRWELVDTGGGHALLDPHVALCLLRNHLRVWLVAHKILPPAPAWLPDTEGVWLWSSNNAEGDTEDEALLAAVAAAEGDTDGPK